MRQLSIKDLISLVFNGVLNKIWISLWVFMLLMFFFLYSDGDSRDLQLNFGSTKTVNGFVKKFEETNVAVNEQQVVMYFYGFSIAGDVYNGVSYGTSYHESDEQVTIEYLLSDPGYSRISGMDNTTMGLGILYFIAVVFIILTLILSYSIYKAFKYGSIIKNGRVTIAQRIRIEETNVTINDSVQYRMIYEFKAYNDPFELVHKTIFTENYEEEEEVVFNRNKPEEAILVVELPVKIQNKIT